MAKLLLLLRVVMLLVPAAASAGLDDIQLRGLLSGKSIVGPEWTMYLHPDGQLNGTANDASDSGRWEVASGLLCVRWDHWLASKRVCWAPRLRPTVSTDTSDPQTTAEPTTIATTLQAGNAQASVVAVADAGGDASSTSGGQPATY